MTHTEKVVVVVSVLAFTIARFFHQARFAGMRKRRAHR
jgi:hypothetical protein